MNPLSKEFHLEIPVLWSQCDPNGHLNVGNFQVFLHEGRMAALDEAGLSYAKMKEENIGPMILRSETDFKSEIRYPDSVLVITKYGDFQGARCKAYQQLIKRSDNKIACESISTCIMFDFSKKRPWKFSDEFLKKLEIL